MLEERLNYFSLLSVENYITKSLSHVEAIKQRASKNVGTKVLHRYFGQLINTTNVILLDFVMFVVFVRFFKCEICCDLFSHSK
jgi:hypothetical protein